jgi:F0F1-type ATP synthase membrane subunit b/b'
MSRTPGLVSCLTHFSYPRHPLINLTDELTKTRKARPNQIPFFVLIAALISFAFRVVSDFLTFIAEWTRPRYEATRDTTQEYINNAGQKADEAKKYAEDRYHDARKYGEDKYAEARKRGQEVEGQAKEAGEEAKGQAKETGEQAKEKAQETKEQGKEQANKAKK